MAEVRYGKVRGIRGYRVGTDGSVWKFRGGEPLRQLPTHKNRSGYERVSLRLSKGLSVPKNVHWLVLEAFVGPRPEGMIGCHKNDIKTDNRLENLYWGTPASNMRDAIANERRPTRKPRERRSYLETDFLTLSAVAKSLGTSAHAVKGAVSELGIELLFRPTSNRHGVSRCDVNRIATWLTPKDRRFMKGRKPAAAAS